MRHLVRDVYMVYLNTTRGAADQWIGARCRVAGADYLLTQTHAAEYEAWPPGARTRPLSSAADTQRGIPRPAFLSDDTSRRRIQFPVSKRSHA